MNGTHTRSRMPLPVRVGSMLLLALAQCYSTAASAQLTLAEAIATAFDIPILDPPHSAHAQVRTRSGRVSLTVPQAAQVFEDGNQRSTFTTWHPYQLPLYTSISLKADHPASLIDFARWRFANIPLTFRSSSAMSRFSATSLQLSL